VIGEIHITLKKGEPYDSWKVVRTGLEIGALRFGPARFVVFARDQAEFITRRSRRMGKG